MTIVTVVHIEWFYGAQNARNAGSWVVGVIADACGLNLYIFHGLGQDKAFNEVSKADLVFFVQIYKTYAHAGRGEVIGCLGYAVDDLSLYREGYL